MVSAAANRTDYIRLCLGTFAQGTDPELNHAPFWLHSARLDGWKARGQHQASNGPAQPDGLQPRSKRVCARRIRDITVFLCASADPGSYVHTARRTPTDATTVCSCPERRLRRTASSSSPSTRASTGRTKSRRASIPSSRLSLKSRNLRSTTTSLLCSARTRIRPTGVHEVPSTSVVDCGKKAKWDRLA